MTRSFSNPMLPTGTSMGSVKSLPSLLDLPSCKEQKAYPISTNHLLRLPSVTGRKNRFLRRHTVRQGKAFFFLWSPDSWCRSQPSGNRGLPGPIAIVMLQGRCPTTSWQTPQCPQSGSHTQDHIKWRTLLSPTLWRHRREMSPALVLVACEIALYFHRPISPP